jgi:hypothetical protein
MPEKLELREKGMQGALPMPFFSFFYPPSQASTRYNALPIQKFR